MSPKFKSFGEAFGHLNLKGEAVHPQALEGKNPQQEISQEAERVEEKVPAKIENSDAPAELNPEDQALFESIVKLLNINPKRHSEEKRYWRIHKLIRDSHKYDVSFDIDRWIRPGGPGGNDSPELKTLAEVLRKRGQRSEAVSWLRSSLPEGMKYGTATRDERLKKAEAFAKIAGTSLAEIIKEEKISL